MASLSRKLRILLLGCLGFLTTGFVPTPTTPTRFATSIDVASARFRGTNPSESDETHFLLEEFKTHNGELVNPYNILNIKRDADRTEIRKAYIDLSKRYHPDGVRHRDILPGKW